MRPIKTIRFWIWHNESPVRLSLQDGQELQLTGGGHNEEGYSYWSDTYSREDNIVRCEHFTTSRDCDGRLDTDSVSQFEFGDRAVDENEFAPGILFPTWKKRHSGQRDYNAEAAGY